MDSINQAHGATKYVKTHPGSHLDYQQKKQAINNFSKRMEKLIKKLEEPNKNQYCTDAFVAIGYELARLREDFQKLATQCESSDQMVFQTGQLLMNFEMFFQKIDPLKYV